MSESQKSFFHASFNFYKVNDIIKKKYKLRHSILSIYNKKLKSHNADSLIYMLDEIQEEYLDTYDYMYEVIPHNPLKCRMEFSPYLLETDFNIIKKKLGNPTDEEKLIELFANAYTFNLEEDLLNALCELLDYDEEDKNKIEYVSSSVIVKSVIKDNKN